MRYVKLFAFIIFGICLIFIAGIGVVKLKSYIESMGIKISSEVFIVVFCGVLGGVYGGLAKYALHVTSKWWPKK